MAAQTYFVFIVNAPNVKRFQKGRVIKIIIKYFKKLRGVGGRKGDHSRFPYNPGMRSKVTTITTSSFFVLFCFCFGFWLLLLLLLLLFFFVVFDEIKHIIL